MIIPRLISLAGLGTVSLGANEPLQPAEVLLGGSNQPSIPTPEQILGFPLGARAATVPEIDACITTNLPAAIPAGRSITLSSRRRPITTAWRKFKHPRGSWSFLMI